jgi:hypothetical protein
MKHKADPALNLSCQSARRSRSLGDGSVGHRLKPNSSKRSPATTGISLILAFLTVIALYLFGTLIARVTEPKYS